MKATKLQAKQTKMLLIVLLTVFTYAVFFVFLYPELMAIENTSLLLGFVILITLALAAYFAIWLKAYSEEANQVRRKLRHYEAMLAKETHTFYVSDAVKETIIQNEHGDAIVKYSFRCINNPESALKRIRLNITHDGKLVEDSISCSVNESDTPVREIERLLVLDAESMKPKTPMPNILRFSIEPKNSIAKGDRFSYSYSYKAEKLFRDAFETQKEFTQTLLLHPTDHLKTLVEAPEGYFFDSMKFQVFDRDEVEHVAEEERIRTECPPFLTHDKRILCWDVIDPSLANIYRLYFSLKKELGSRKTV